MRKPRTFADPNPHEKYVPITSNATGSEKLLVETFDPIAPDAAENLTGYIIRQAVDIARYKASIKDHPEKTKHYDRLTRCASFAAKMRVARAYKEEDGKQIIDNVTTAIDHIDWTTVPRVVRPVIIQTNEAEATVAFTFEEWHDANEARATGMNQTETTWAAWKHGEPATEEAPGTAIPFSVSTA